MTIWQGIQIMSDLHPGIVNSVKQWTSTVKGGWLKTNNIGWKQAKHEIEHN